MDGVSHKAPRMLKMNEKATDGDLLAQALLAANRSHRRALSSRGKFWSQVGMQAQRQTQEATPKKDVGSD